MSPDGLAGEPSWCRGRSLSDTKDRWDWSHRGDTMDPSGGDGGCCQKQCLLEIYGSVTSAGCGDDDLKFRQMSG